MEQRRGKLPWLRARGQEDAEMEEEAPADLAAVDVGSLTERIASLDLGRLRSGLDSVGYASAGRLLDATACQALAALFEEEEHFRKEVAMARHAYGEGHYRYFGYPLPALVAEMREAVYRLLLPVARDWTKALKSDAVYPDDYPDYLALCHAAGQRQATPLILQHQAGGYNRLHQDLYGDLAFPLQAVVQLSGRRRDFTGGEAVLVESRARMQGRAHVLPLRQGEMLIFANAVFPAPGKKGRVKATLRHGVAEITGGRRLALGLILHDAKS